MADVERPEVAIPQPDGARLHQTQSKSIAWIRVKCTVTGNTWSADHGERLRFEFNFQLYASPYFFRKIHFVYLNQRRTKISIVPLSLFQFSLQDNGSAKYFQGAMHTSNMGEKVAQVRAHLNCRGEVTTPRTRYLSEAENLAQRERREIPRIYMQIASLPCESRSRRQGTWYSFPRTS